MMFKRLGFVASLAVLVTATTVVDSQAASTLTQGCVESVPEPGSSDPVDICYSLYRPAGATAEAPVPLVFHSHGWGGSRTNQEGAFADWTDAGFGVLSFDQRGFGESGGQAHIENPDFEGEDVRRLVDVVAALDWVVADGPGDPRIGAIGGSYGGGYQFVGAFTDLMVRGETRFDALAPEITWWDLKDSLAPAEVVRTAWVTALFGAGVTALPDEVRRAFVLGAATGEWPDQESGFGLADMDAFFLKTGPSWHVSQGRRLDIPVLFGQGMSDNLFNANQGIHNFERALTDDARAESIFIGYNGGHALPNVLPPSGFPIGDPCSEEVAGGPFSDLAIQFFTEKLKGGDEDLAPWYGTYNLATVGGACLSTGSDLGTPTHHALGTVATPTGVGPPVHVKIADGPLAVAGIPSVEADVTPLGVDARAFFALSVGATPATALVVQDNMLPIHEHGTPLGTTNHRTIELPGVAVEVPAGQSLYLTVSAVSDMSFGHGSRTPGALLLENTTVAVPQI